MDVGPDRRLALVVEERFAAWRRSEPDRRPGSVRSDLHRASHPRTANPFVYLRFPSIAILPSSWTVGQGRARRLYRSGRRDKPGTGPALVGIAIGERVVGYPVGGFG